MLCVSHHAAMQVAYKQSNKAVVGSNVLTHVVNVKRWLAPHLEELHQHTQPRLQIQSELKWKDLASLQEMVTHGLDGTSYCTKGTSAAL